jgi:phospholipase C
MKRVLVVLSVTLMSACNPQRPSWGLEAIDSMQTRADDPTLGCGVVLPVDTSKVEQRSQCAFGRGDTTAETLGLDPATVAKIPIRHVIVLMKENRSFDHLLGKLHDRGQPEAEAVPASFANPDPAGVMVSPSHPSTTCIELDPEHQYRSMVAGINHGAMDGFVKNAARSTGSDGHFVMGQYDQPDLPFYYFLANTFALADRHFAPAQSGTFCDRNFWLFGHNAGAVDTGIVYPDPSTPSVLTLLQNAGWTWGSYGDDEPIEGSLGWKKGDPGTHSLKDFFDALDHGTLPNVALVDGLENIDDDHPTADLQKGEAALKAIYDRAITSPQWGRLAIIWTYDEGGGFPDHVPPPKGCQAVPGSPFIDLGVRIPLVAISPWAKRHYVSHAVHDHTAITRFIATLFNLPALTARDANSDSLFDLFDFSCTADRSVPAAPAAGTGGCANPP